jgi:inner membrane protein
MNPPAQPARLSTPNPRLAPHSMGLKLLIVCGLALAMMIPAFFVEGLLSDRTARASVVSDEVSAQVGGPQTFLGPTLAIPYHMPSANPPEYLTRGVYLVFPSTAQAHVKLLTEERRRSLFRVPVFRAEAQMDASFDLNGVPRELPRGAELEWDRAELVVGVSDLRGALEDATLVSDAGRSTLATASASRTLTLGPEDANKGARLSLLGSRMANIGAGSQFSVHATLRFSGAQRIAVLPYGDATRLTVDGDWPDPGFNGGFLPATHQASRNGFSASWFVPMTARGVHAEGPEDTITGLDRAALGVSLVEVADPYQSVDRSLKYSPLILGLVFLSYFVFEVTAGRRVHPAQYVLVGLAQTVFYLLLLSLAERAGFAWGYLFAGAATVLLLARNAGWIFNSAKQGWRALGVFSTLYTMIYLLLKLEDNALLIGSAASFAAITAVMYFTRDLDWYHSLAEHSENGSSGMSPSPSVSNAAV